MSWPKVRLGDVCEVKAGRDYKDVESPDGKYPIYGTGGVMGMSREWRCPAGSVIVGRKGTLDNPMLINEPFWNIDTCFGVVPSGKLLPAYLWRFCQNFDFYSLVPASGRPSTTSDAVKAINLPLPPLAEQKKIVEKVEKALKRVDALKAQFERMEKSAADYFKAALAETFAAVKGEKVKLGDVCETISVGIVIRPTRYYTAKGIKAFRNTNIRACEIRDDDWVQVTDAAINENPRCEVKMGDVVIARSGLPGTAAAVTSAYDGFAAVDILIAKPIAARADYHYLAYAINTSEAQRQIKKMNNGVAQAHIGVNSVSSLLLTLPAKESQKAVVDALDAAKSKSERMVTAARRGIAICGKMRKAILAEAFQ